MSRLVRAAPGSLPPVQGCLHRHCDSGHWPASIPVCIEVPFGGSWLSMRVLMYAIPRGHTTHLKMPRLSASNRTSVAACVSASSTWPTTRSSRSSFCRNSTRMLSSLAVLARGIDMSNVPDSHLSDPAAGLHTPQCMLVACARSQQPGVLQRHAPEARRRTCSHPEESGGCQR